MYAICSYTTHMKILFLLMHRERLVFTQSEDLERREVGFGIFAHLEDISLSRNIERVT